MRSSTIKSIAAIVLTGAGTAVVVGFRPPDTPVVAATTTVTTATSAGTGTTGTASSGTTAGTTSTATASAAATAPAATTAPATSTTTSATGATYADGTWTGAAVQEPWGTFQVQAVVSGGRITDVVLVSSPQDGHSSRINSQAVPILTQSVVAAQSASVDMVSGATWTSQSYATSLQAALDEARAAAQAAA